jgi:predicted nucleic acid-binding protein
MMRRRNGRSQILLDSNILIDLVTEDPAGYEWSMANVRQHKHTSQLCVNAVILGEILPSFTSTVELNAAVRPDQVTRLDIPHEAGVLAGRAQILYRHRGGTKTGTLCDFLIGAHAEAGGLTILTRDPKRFRTYFPAVPLITPEDE